MTVDHGRKAGGGAAGVHDLAEDVRRRMRTSAITRRVPTRAMRTRVDGGVRPRAGDLLLARVEELGAVTHVDLPSGRASVLRPGDLIVVAYGHHVSVDGVVAHVPRALGPVALVDPFGIAAHVPVDAVDRPTVLHPMGLVGSSEGTVLNLDGFQIMAAPMPVPRPRVIAFVGVHPAGVTADAVNSLSARDVRCSVAVIAADPGGAATWSLGDAGADAVLDLSAVGLHGAAGISGERLAEATLRMVSTLCAGGADLAIVDVRLSPDDPDVAQMLAVSALVDLIDGVVVIAHDSLAATQAHTLVARLGHDVVAVAGAVAASPVAAARVRASTGVDVIGKSRLADPDGLAAMLGVSRTRSQRRAPASAVSAVRDEPTPHSGSSSPLTPPELVHAIRLPGLMLR